MKRQMAMKRCEVFGIGSAYGADQVGWLVLERVQQVVGGGVGIHRLQTPLDLLSHASTDQIDAGAEWILIDACIGEEEGRIHRWRWPQVSEMRIGLRNVSSHGVGLLEVLRMGQELGLLPGEVWVYGIEVGVELAVAGQEMLLDWTPSDVLRESIHRCCAQIANRSVCVGH